jgi:hypothetical protein
MAHSGPESHTTMEEHCNLGGLLAQGTCQKFYRAVCCRAPVHCVLGAVQPSKQEEVKVPSVQVNNIYFQ